MTTMRERLIAAVLNEYADDVPSPTRAASAVDAILSELREPDRGMIEAVLGRKIKVLKSETLGSEVDIISQADGIAMEFASAAITAMIDHIRSEKP